MSKNKKAAKAAAPIADKAVDKTAKVETKKKEQKIPTFIPEPVEEVKLGNKIGVPVSESGLSDIKRSSTDAKARLVEYGYHRFVNNQEFKDKCPEAWRNTTQVCDVVWLLAMVDIRNEISQLNTNGQLVAKIPEDQLMPLTEVADMLGIQLATPKALTGPDGEKQLTIDFMKSEVPEELTEKKPAKPEIPELDIEKVGSDHEMICDALSYLLRKNQNIAISLIETIDWYRKLCINNADDANLKISIDNRTVDEWMNEIFHLVPVTSLLKGLGRSVYLYTKTEESPVSAHCLLHGQLKDTPEEDIVRILRVLIQENFRYNLEDKLDANGNVIKTNKIENPVDDKAIQATIGSLGVEYIDKLMSNLTASVPEGATDEQLAEIGENRKKARKIISLVRANYYPGKVEPTNDQLRFAVGKIINLYRSPMDKLAEFEGPIPTLVGEYPETKVPTEEEKKI